MLSEDRAAERFNRFWDALVRSSRETGMEATGPHSHLHDAVRALHAADDAPHADPQFINRLEDALMNRSNPTLHPNGAITVPASFRPLPPAAGGSAKRPKQRPPQIRAVMATAALIAMMVAVGALYVLGRDDGPKPNFAANSIALVQGSPTATECDAAPRTTAPSISGTPMPPPINISKVTVNVFDGGADYMVEQSDLPTGQPASAEQIEGITATLRQFVACGIRASDAGANLAANSNAHERQFGLFTDDYLRRHMAATPETVDAGTPAPPWWADYWYSSASWSAGSGTPTNVEVLPDGRVSAWVDDGIGDVSLVVFVKRGDRWRIDERAALAPLGSLSATPAAGGVAQPPQISLILVDIIYSPDQLGIPPGTDVALTLANIGAVRHTFNIDSLGIHVELAAGSHTTITVHAPVGTYQFYCSVPGHQAAGMSGVLLVDARYQLPAPALAHAPATPQS